ncbi:uncharacterized protein [Amphiura filiformis]|uniref:uncharacterized protein n=1 Tax=Amphiura filiformis TaxID=82378 RepID=UPI003B20DB78
MMLNTTVGTSAPQLVKLDERPGACSRCKTAFTQEFPCVKRAPSRQQSSKSDRTGLRESASTPYRLPRLHVAISQPSLRLTHDKYNESHDSFKIRSDTFEKFLKSRRKPVGPPNTMAQKMRSDNIHMPTLQVANSCQWKLQDQKQNQN